MPKDVISNQDLESIKEVLKQESINIEQVLKDFDLDVNAVNVEGKSILYLCAEKVCFLSEAKLLPVVKKLVELGAKNIADKVSYTPILQFEDMPNTWGNTPLHILAGKNHDELLKAVLEIPGVNVNKLNNLGHSPLHFAAKSATSSKIKTLLESGANKEQLDGAGNTPLETAMNNGQGEYIAEIKRLLNPEPEYAQGAELSVEVVGCNYIESSSDEEFDLSFGLGDYTG